MIYLKIFWCFIKLGFLSFGGGYPMLSLIMEIATKDVGLTAQEFADMTALELLASGPVALNSATYIGFIKGGFAGATVATLGLIIPSLILASALYYFLSKFQKNKYVQKFIQAIKFSCAGVLLTTAFTLSENILLYSGVQWNQSFFEYVNWFAILIFVIACVVLMKFKKNAIMVIVGAGILGLFLL